MTRKMIAVLVVMLASLGGARCCQEAILPGHVRVAVWACASIYDNYKQDLLPESEHKEIYMDDERKLGLIIFYQHHNTKRYTWMMNVSLRLIYTVAFYVASNLISSIKCVIKTTV